MELTSEINEVLRGQRRWAAMTADCKEFLAALPADCADLVFASPPYADARTYGIDAVYGCQEWVDWMLTVTEAAIRVSRGLVLWVVAGVQRDKCYWPTCEGLVWEWWKRGHQLWRPCIWWKVDADEGGSGIPGSGGKQWLRNDWEYVLAFKREGWLPWADPLVMGHAPVCDQVGGEMSNRTADGRRINAKVFGPDYDPGDKHGRGGNLEGREKEGRKKVGTNRRANGKRKKVGTTRGPNGEVRMAPGPIHDADGNIVRTEGRPFPKIANPGNVLPLVVKARVGGGHMGSRLCHDNEAPFPEDLAAFFIRSFCPPGGLCVDPFCGSGTTVSVAVQQGRRALGGDLRESQVDLTRRRLAGVTPPLFVEEPPA